MGTRHRRNLSRQHSPITVASLTSDTAAPADRVSHAQGTTEGRHTAREETALANTARSADFATLAVGYSPATSSLLCLFRDRSPSSRELADARCEHGLAVVPEAQGGVCFDSSEGSAGVPRPRLRIDVRQVAY